jgi:hypothetical protein
MVARLSDCCTVGVDIVFVLGIGSKRSKCAFATLDSAGALNKKRHPKAALKAYCTTASISMGCGKRIIRSEGGLISEAMKTGFLTKSMRKAPADDGVCEGCLAGWRQQPCGRTVAQTERKRR